MVGGCGAGVVELEPGSLGAVVEPFGFSRISFRGRPGLPLGGAKKGWLLRCWDNGRWNWWFRWTSLVQPTALLEGVRCVLIAA